MRLIDADELKKAFDLYTDRKGYLKADPEDIIDNAPTVDISETISKFRQTAYLNGFTTGLNKRQHAKWLCNDNYIDCKCSYCGSYALERGDYPELSKFCPTCGAEMEMPKNEG